MPQLEKKLDTELQTGSAIVACRFPFPTWIPDETIGEGIDSVWLYKVNKKSKPDHREETSAQVNQT